ncbi:MAG: antibiotic biosynthesis monooxygenase [Mucilaginibacter sp.]|nr:antibiotic biosynthesis monooxygenase [Mucilaginibacter sp.]
MKNNKRHELPIDLTLRRGLFLILAAGMLILCSYKNASAQQTNRVVHLAKLQIDSAQLESYKALLKEGIETAVRVEPGVLTLYAVYEKDRPTHVTVFEIYADTAAYKAHLQMPHFKKYKSATRDMVKSLELVDVMPIALGAKKKL